MATTQRARRRQRGEIEPLPSGALRVRVYAGIEPVSGKRHYLVETVPAGPQAAAEAERTRTRLLGDVDGGKQARTSATVATLLDRYLEMVEVDESTRVGYESLIRVHIKPLLGGLPVGRVRAEVLDSFFAQLRTCRRHCPAPGRSSAKRQAAEGLIDHRTSRAHECDARCLPHSCRPLSKARIRQIHVVLRCAFALAERWEWTGTNVVAKTRPPRAPKPRPQPPTAVQAAQIASASWNDPLWGMFVWLAMTTGARRGELSALRWDRIDFSTGVLTVRSSIAETGGRTWEKDTKDHQQRRIVLDPQTLALLHAFLVRRAQEASALGIELPVDGFVFSLEPDGSTWLRPGTATEHFSRMCAKLGYSIHLHLLRHYSATELIAAGVDVRTVAGRLGHGGGGVTTLRVYSAWVAEADQRASLTLATRMPELPGAVPRSTTPTADLPTQALARADEQASSAPPTERDDESPYRRIAADLRGAIRLGFLGSGDQLPAIKALARQYDVSVGTAHRAVTVLAEAGLVSVATGQRTLVI